MRARGEYEVRYRAYIPSWLDTSQRKQKKRFTLMMHESPNLFPSAQIPDFDNLVCAPRGEPFPAVRRDGDGFYAGDVRGEDEDGVQGECPVWAD